MKKFPFQFIIDLLSFFSNPFKIQLSSPSSGGPATADSRAKSINSSARQPSMSSSA